MRRALALSALLVVGCDGQAGGPGLEPPGSGERAGGDSVINGGMTSVPGASAAGTGTFGNPIGAGGTGGAAGAGGAGGTSVTESPADGGVDAGVDATVLDAAVEGGLLLPEGAVDCAPHRIFCKIATPTCGVFEVPRREGSCYGACVPVGDCYCESPDDCPDRNQYTCINSTNRCSPYL